MEYLSVSFIVAINWLKDSDTINNKYHEIDLPGYVTKKTVLPPQWFDVPCLIAFIIIPV
jgi:hypothetical protein